MLDFLLAKYHEQVTAQGYDGSLADEVEAAVKSLKTQSQESGVSHFQTLDATNLGQHTFDDFVHFINDYIRNAAQGLGFSLDDARDIVFDSSQLSPERIALFHKPLSNIIDSIEKENDFELGDFLRCMQRSFIKYFSLVDDLINFCSCLKYFENIAKLKEPSVAFHTPDKSSGCQTPLSQRLTARKGRGSYADVTRVLRPLQLNYDGAPVAPLSSRAHSRNTVRVVDSSRLFPAPLTFRTFRAN